MLRRKEDISMSEFEILDKWHISIEISEPKLSLILKNCITNVITGIIWFVIRLVI